MIVALLACVYIPTILLLATTEMLAPWAMFALLVIVLLAFLSTAMMVTIVPTILAILLLEIVSTKTTCRPAAMVMLALSTIRAPMELVSLVATWIVMTKIFVPTSIAIAFPANVFIPTIPLLATMEMLVL